MIENKNTRRLEIYKEAILLEAKKKLKMRDFIQLQQILNKLKTINRFGD
jgi:hypothetical protein